MKIRGSRDRRDWMATKHIRPEKAIPSAPGWNPAHMSGEDVIRWAAWAGVRLHLQNGGVNPTWRGPTPYRILGALVPYREEIVRHLKGEVEEPHPFLGEEVN